MNRRTRIICTLGPASDDLETIRAMIGAGMDVARINFSHGSLEDHERRIEIVRTVAAETNRPIAVLGDLPGPKIRVGVMAEPVRLRHGEPFTLTLRDTVGGPGEVQLDSPTIFRSVQPGDSLFLDDGIIELRVERCEGDDLRTVVVNGGTLSSHKGVSVPNVSLEMESLTPEDRVALRFAVQHELDWIAASFVRSATDVQSVRGALHLLESDIPIIAKIEKTEAVEQLDAVVAAADGIMVARGDLGVECPIYQVPALQKRIIATCNAGGKPVVTATQMLDSMIRNPRPTRAEVSDVANAVLDGTDCVMLSGETAVGAYPVDAVQMMREIVLQGEAALASDRFHGAAREGRDRVTDSISHATCDLARELNAAAIVTATSSGYTARMVSRHRPRTPIIGVTSSRKTYQRLALTWGVYPVLTPPVQTTDETLISAVRVAVDHQLVKPGDLVLITAGVPAGIAGNTNLIKVHRIGAPLTAFSGPSPQRGAAP